LLIQLRMPFFQQCMFGLCTCGNCWTMCEVVSPHNAVPCTPCCTFWWTQLWLILNPHCTSLSTCLWLTTLAIWLFHVRMPLHYQIWSCLDYANYTDRAAVLGYLLHIFKHLKPPISHVKMYVFFMSFWLRKQNSIHIFLTYNLLSWNRSTQLSSDNYIYSSLAPSLSPYLFWHTLQGTWFLQKEKAFRLMSGKGTVPSL